MLVSEVCLEVYGSGRARANRMSQGHEPNNEAQWTPRRSQDERQVRCRQGSLGAVFQSFQRSSSRYRKAAILRIILARSKVSTTMRGLASLFSRILRNQHHSILRPANQRVMWLDAWLASRYYCMHVGARDSKSLAALFFPSAPPDHLLLLSLHN